MGFHGRVHLRHGMTDSGLLGRNARREDPLLILGVHVYVNRSIGHVRMKLRELDGREPYGQEKNTGRGYTIPIHRNREYHTTRNGWLIRLGLDRTHSRASLNVNLVQPCLWVYVQRRISKVK